MTELLERIDLNALFNPASNNNELFKLPNFKQQPYAFILYLDSNFRNQNNKPIIESFNPENEKYIVFTYDTTIYLQGCCNKIAVYQIKPKAVKFFKIKKNSMYSLIILDHVS